MEGLTMNEYEQKLNSTISIAQLSAPKQYTLNDAIKTSQQKGQRLVGLAREIKAKLTGGAEDCAKNPERMAGMIGDVDEIGCDIDTAIDILSVVNERLA